MPHGTCEKCEKSFRLPEGRTRGRCPRCGSRLRVESAEREAPEQVPCPHCGQSTRSTDTRCLSCGSLLERASGGSFGHHQWLEAYRTFTRVRLTFFFIGVVLLYMLYGFGSLWVTVGASAAPQGPRKNK